MTVYVDPAAPAPCLEHLVPGWPLLTVEGPVEELHAFARSIGVGRGWFSVDPVPCYALTPSARDRAERAGAALPAPAATSRTAVYRLPRQRAHADVLLPHR